MIKKRPTIKDIAKAANVTHSTVSRIINNSPVIGKETRMRVLKIIEKMDYQPNLIARGLVKKRTQVLALITPVLDPHILPIIKGVEESCKGYNYSLMLYSTDYWADEGMSYLQIAENWLVDGILILNDVYYKKIPADIKRLQRRNIPFIFINKYLGTGQVNTVSVDNYEAVYQAIKHLVSSGHKRIGTLIGGIRAVDGFERFDAYKKALEMFNLRYDESIVGDAGFGENEAYEEMRKILSLSSRKYPTAMFCANDRMAIGAIRAIQERKLRVPQDIAVVGFDDIETGRYFKPTLTTIKPPLETVGKVSVRLMMKIIENPKRQIEEIPLRARLIIRESSSA